MESSTTAPNGPEKQPRQRWKGVLPLVVPVLVVLGSALALAGIHQAWPREYFPPTQDDPAPRLDEYMSAVMASRIDTLFEAAGWDSAPVGALAAAALTTATTLLGGVAIARCLRLYVVAQDPGPATRRTALDRPPIRRT